MIESLVNLGIKVIGDIADFRTAMQQTRDIAKDAADNVKKQFDGMNTAIKTAALGLVSFGTVRAMKGVFDDVVATGNALKDMSERTGITVERWSALMGVAKAGGHDINALEGAVTKLSKGLVNSDEETKGAGKALAFLGVEARDSFGKMRSGDAIIQDVAKSLAKYSDGLGKNAIVQDLFGKSGAANLPMLKDLAEAGELVGKVTAEQAEQADKYERTVKELTKSKEAWKKEIAYGVLPVAQSFADMLLDLQKQNNNLNKTVKDLRKDGSIEDWARDGARAIAFLIDAARAVPVVFKAIGAQIAGLAFDVASVGQMVGGALQIMSNQGNAMEVAKGLEMIREGWRDVGRGAQMAATDFDDLGKVFTDGSFSAALEKRFAIDDLGKAVEEADSKTRHAKNGLDAYAKTATETKEKVTDSALGIQKAWANLVLDQTKSGFKISQDDIQFNIDEINRMRQAVGDSEALITRVGELSTQQFKIMGDSIVAERAVIEQALDGLMAKVSSAKSEDDRNKYIAAYLTEAKKLVPLNERLNDLDIARKKNIADLTAAMQKLTAENGKQLGALSDVLIKEREANEAIKQSTEEIGLNKQELLDLNIARLDAKIALGEIVAGTEMATEADLRQLDVLRELRGVLVDRKALEAAKSQAEEARQSALSLTSSMNEFFTDLIMNGRSAFDNVVNSAKRMMAQLLAQFATKLVLNIGMSLLGGSSGGLGDSILGALGLGSGAGGAGGGLGGALGGVLGIGGGLGSLTGLMGLGSGAGILGTLGAGANLAVTGLMGGGLAGMGGGISMAFGSGMLAGLGSLLPILGPIAAIAGLISVFAKDEKGFKIDNSVVGVGNPMSHWTPSALGSFDYSGDVDPKVFAPFTARINKLDDIIAHDFLDEETLAMVRGQIQAVKNPRWWNLDDKDAINKASVYFLKERYGIAFDAINETIADAIRGFSGTADELLTYLDAVTMIDWDSISGPLAEAVAALSTTTDGVQQAIALLQSADAIYDLIGTDFIQAGADLFAAQSATAMDAYRIQGNALDKLVDAAMAGNVGFEYLARGAKEFADAAVRAFADIAAARVNVTSTIDDAVRQFRLDGMKPEDRIAFLRSETEGYRRQLGSATDPKEIERLINLIVKNSQDAFNLLTPEQQAASRDDYIQGLITARDEAQRNLTRVEETLRANTEASLADAKKALDAILEALAKNGKDNADAIADFGNSVDDFGTHVRTPQKIVIVRDDVEVGGGA